MNRLIEFLKEAQPAELAKVSWPTRQELYESTILVIVSVILVTVFIGAIDFVVNRMLQIFAQSL